jgi:hypothetical protein
MSIQTYIHKILDKKKKKLYLTPWEMDWLDPYIWSKGKSPSKKELEIIFPY